MKRSIYKIITYSLILTPVILCSCQKKRDWTCTCQVTGNNFGTFTKTINYETQKKATDDCGAWGKQLMGSGGNYNCSIRGED